METVAMTAPAGDAGNGEGTPPANSSESATDGKLGEPGKAALDAERKARGEAEKLLKAAQAKIKEHEDAGKTELEKLTGDRDGHRSRADAAEMQLLKLNVGLAKGLSAKQAARLVGSNKAELEKDADELLEAFGASGGGKPPAGGKARETLTPTGGGDPGDLPPETDPRKLAELIAGK